MSSTLIYEQALYSDTFKNDVERGFYTEAQLLKMLEDNQLNDYQLQVLQELAPMLGGLKNVAGQIGSKIKQGVGNVASNIKNSYQTGVQQQQLKNKRRKQGQLWNKLDQSIQRAKILEQLTQFKQAFAADQDKYITQLSAYINTSFLELQSYVATYYPETGVKVPKNYTPTSFSQPQQQQQSNQSGQQPGIKKQQIRTNQAATPQQTNSYTQ